MYIYLLIYTIHKILSYLLEARYIVLYNYNLSVQ